MAHLQNQYVLLSSQDTPAATPIDLDSFPSKTRRPLRSSILPTFLVISLALNVLAIYSVFNLTKWVIEKPTKFGKYSLSHCAYDGD